jgi:hypothetical protein
MEADLQVSRYKFQGAFPYCFNYGGNCWINSCQFSAKAGAKQYVSTLITCVITVLRDIKYDH